MMTSSHVIRRLGVCFPITGKVCLRYHRNQGGMHLLFGVSVPLLASSFPSTGSSSFYAVHL